MSFDLRHVQTDVLDTAYLAAGSPDALPLILLHGWPDDAATWTAIAAPLVSGGFRVVAPFLRGCGPTRFLRSDTTRSGQLAALGQDTLDLIDALGLDRVVLVGHDWGARAAAIAASQLPLSRMDGLVLISVGYGTNDPTQTLSLTQIHNYWYHWYMALPRGRTLVHEQRRELTRYLWDVWGAPGWRLPDEQFETLLPSFDNPDWAEIVVHSYRHRWGHASGDPRYDALEARLKPAPVLSVPTLVLHGSADRCNHPETSAGKERFFSGSYHRRILEGVGHFPQREAPELVAEALLRWLH